MAAAQVQAQSVSYDNTGAWDGVQSLSVWGTGLDCTATYGETFFAPSLSSVSLDSFTFYLQGDSYFGGSGNSVTFQADIYSWDGINSVATGPALFSQNFLFTDNGSFQAVTANTGGITLTPGASYIALFTTSDPASLGANGNSTAGFYWERVGSSEVNDGGGSGVYYNNSTSSQLTDGSTWDGGTNSFGTFAWQATFNTDPTPEPSTIALAGLGIAALLLRRNKSKK